MNLRFEQIPRGWLDIFEIINIVDDCAIFAGGALRDYEHDVAHKDLDFFVREGFYARCFYALMKEGATLRSGAPSEYDGGSMITDACTLDFERNEISLVAMKNEFWHSPSAWINSFDFGLCQIAVYGGVIHTTQAYNKDRAAKTWTLMHCENNARFIRSMERFARLKHKYPEHKLAIPDRYLPFKEPRPGNRDDEIKF